MNALAVSPSRVWLSTRLSSPPGCVKPTSFPKESLQGRPRVSLPLSQPPAFPIFPLKCASSSASAGAQPYSEEPATGVKFATSVTLPGCSASLALQGTGCREKVFAIIGVKVYAAGLYMNPSIVPELVAWKGKSKDEIWDDKSFFDTILRAPLEKSLQIVLVRDVDGKTFWDALDEAISPRIATPTPADESALKTFRGIFVGRPLKKGTFIFLTWLDSSRMLVSVSNDGLPTSIDAELGSDNVASSLFDVFFGTSPVSPSLKTSVISCLASILK
ncbi:hypothetical protein MLD38_034143 [Melastoma candidum]|uniref:Uncharacterized protein n=1 Tax=Melastoma candidum TaxID=119954 RepID=A0ACB9MBB3_9MYRT|nr:hypothetical protein MLD38_034143 [Melastoma candidum]